MIGIGLFLRSYWKEIAIALVVLGAYWYVTNLQSTVKDQERDIRTLTAEKVVLEANNVVLETAIKTTNAALGKFADAGGKTQREFDKVNAHVTAQSQVLFGKLASVAKDKKPVTCEATIQYLVDGAKEFKK